MLLNLKVATIRPNAKVPSWGSQLAAAADLYACLDEPSKTITPGQTLMVPCGFKTEFTPGHVALICARSGISVKRGLAPANKVGIIDADYRGEWCVALHNHSCKNQTIEDGERIAQVMFFEVSHPRFEVVTEDKLSETERGEGGFGSTGK